MGQKLDPYTKKFDAQPDSITFTYVGNNGKNKGVRATFDFLALKNDAVYWVELKPAQKIKNRYGLSDGGKWSSPPADEIACAYGFTFRIVTTDQIDDCIYHNTDFLRTYYGANFQNQSK